MTWVEVAPTAALLTLVLLLPGWAYAHQLGVRGLVAVAAAPAITVAVLGVLAVIYGAVGLGWSLGSVVAGLVVLWLALGLAHRAPAERAPRPGLGPAAAGMVAAGVAAGLTLITAVFAAAIGPPDAVPQMHDSLFHLNGAELVKQTGNASPLGAMAGLYGEGRGGGFYPTAWHSLVVLGAAVSGVVPATNAMLVVGVFLPWLLGLAALGHVVAPRHPLVASLAPITAAAAVVFPTVAVLFKGMYPFGLSVALTPGVLALAARVLEPHLARGPRPAVARRAGRGASVRPWLVLAAAAAGVVVAHSSGLAALGFLGAPLVLTACWRAGAHLRAAGRPLLGWATALAPLAAVGLLVVAVFTVPKLRAMADFSSPEGSRSAALLYALVGSTPQHAAGTLAVAVLVLVGLVVAWLMTRWIAWSWLVALVLFVAASGPESPLRTLTGFWYQSPDRLQSLLVTDSAVLAAWGAVALARALHALARRRRGRRMGEASWAVTALIAAAVVLLAGGVSAGFRAHERLATTASAYRPEEMVHPPWATRRELDFLERLDGVLPADAVVVGDPMNGAAFVQVLAERRAYLPILGESALSADQRYLEENFHDIATDPRVCRILREDGVEYYYGDASMPYGSRTLAEKRPGFYGVDVTAGFEPLAAAGTAAVYRITACG